MSINRELLAQCEKMLRFLIAERDCFYEGCSIDGKDGRVLLDEDEEVLNSMDLDIDELQSVIAKAKGEIH